MPTQVATPPAGWYPDPHDGATQRFWDGRTWTVSWPGEPKDLNGARLDGYTAVQSGFKNAFVYRGRASRSAFWWFQLAVGFGWFVLVASTIWLITTLANPSTIAEQNSLNSWLFLGAALSSLIVLVPSIALTVRRLHDINMTGWLVLIYLVPSVGQLLLLILMVLPGTKGPNRFDIPGRPQQQPASMATSAVR